MSEKLCESYEAVVIGGGAAGLSSALMLARSRRSVLVVDAGEPRNAPADAIRGLLGHDGLPPAELLARGRAEVEQYGGRILAAAVAGVSGRVDQFEVKLADGRLISARRLVVATGVIDQLPDIPGLAEQWGSSVVHCPYCHGWEVRDQPIAVLATSPMSVHQALLFSQLSDEVVYFSNNRELDADSAALLAARGVQIEPGRVVAVQSGDAGIVAVQLDSGKLIARSVVVVATALQVRDDAVAALNLPVKELSGGAGSHFDADPFGRTAVAGVWAAGNCAEPFAQVGAAAAAGAMVGAQVNADLVMADARPPSP